MTEQFVHSELDGEIAIIRMDDGKANALSHAMLDQLVIAIDEAMKKAGAVTIIGRPGRFCAGFDLAVMQAGPQQAQGLLLKGVALYSKIFESPVPIVIGCTGHALAGGAILLMAADWRVGADGDFKIGLNEVAIGMPVPKFAIALARHRLSHRHFLAATNHARIFDPATAVDAGYLDESVAEEAVSERAIDHARHLASTLKPGAFVMTRESCRGPIAQAMRSGMEEDIALFRVDG